MHMQKHITITMNRMIWMPSRKLKSLFSVSFHIKVPLSVFIPLDHSPKFKDRGKYHCMAGLQFNKIGFDQIVEQLSLFTLVST